MDRGQHVRLLRRRAAYLRVAGHSERHDAHDRNLVAFCFIIQSIYRQGSQQRVRRFGRRNKGFFKSRRRHANVQRHVPV